MTAKNAVAERIEESPISPLYHARADLRDAMRLISKQEARYLVDTYYLVQRHRIRSQNQTRSLVESGEPQAIVRWAVGSFGIVEEYLQKALDEWSLTTRPGRWLRSVHGIGPVLAAGLLAVIDVEKARTASQVWRFAGLDPSVRWIGAEGAHKLVEELVQHRRATDAEVLEAARRAFRNPTRLRELVGETPTKAELVKELSRRPWNHFLKVLCWKVGESFVKTGGSEKSYYGPIYRERKALEVARNDAGEHAELAAETLRHKRISEPKTKAAYKAGRLPDGRIDQRARRYAVKRLLSHLHWVLHEDRFKRPPPKPYVIEILGHADMLEPPGWPCE